MANMHHLSSWWLVTASGFEPIVAPNLWPDGSPELESMRRHMPDAYFERLDLHGGAGDWVGTLWIDEDAGMRQEPGNATLTDLAVRFGGHSLTFGGNLRGTAILQCLPDFIVAAS